ncbi:uncharacterized protein LOC132287150 isoform X2 [Cornus florida]|uniref:uncharacterized protein LOC132287150 isoform X2 n=1 Tax=Cornus florida TaxID=4283 RepID=UPI00289B4976|nr:uncharacterized protein LOC132287150 isoform X2 [Cornus florida]
MSRLCGSLYHHPEFGIIEDSRFPKSALVFIDAIKKNRSCQKFLRSKLIQIEARIEENQKLKDRVKILKDFQFACRRKTGRALSQKKDARVQLISVPKQRANAKVNEKKVPAIYYGPAENSHVSSYRMALTKFPVSFSREKWTNKEKEDLAKGIKQQFQEALLQKSVDQFSGVGNSSGVANDFDSIIESIRDHDITHDNIRLFLPKVNWDQLASMYIPSRSGAECQTRWLNCEDPLINHHTWTNLEDKNLLHIVQQKGIENWIDIAVSLGTNRTPFQCLARYQRSLNAMILKSEWTEAEDDKLRAAVETFGVSNWQLVASTLEGRTGTQCSNRWKQSLNPARQRVGKWTPDEDKRLKVAVMLFGPKTWKKIAQYVPGRTQVQCRERWVNSLDPSLNLDKWTEEEDSRLEAAIAEHGYCWSKVAACVPPRTDSQCRRRWKVLFPHEVPLLQAAKNIQKAALISNFVDRESERPALGPNDFVPLTLTNSIPESENVNPSEKRKRQSRRRLESKAKANSSSDKKEKSEKVSRLMNNELENSGRGDATSKKKRARKSSSLCPEPTLSTITNSKDVGASDRDSATKKKKAPSGRQKRKSRLRAEPKEFDIASGNNAISEKRTLANPFSNENKGSGPTKEQPLSCPDSNLLMITNGEEACVSGRADATKNKKSSKLHPRKKKCIELPKEVPEITNSDEVETFGGNYSISKKRRKVTKSNLMKSKGGGPTECDLMIGNGEEVFQSGGNDAAKNEMVSKLRPRKNKCIDIQEEVPGMTNSDEVETFCGNGTISKKKRRVTTPHSKKIKSTDPTEDHSLPSPNSTMLVIGSGGEDAAFSRDNAKRNICTQLPEKITERINSNEVETFSGDETISEWMKRLTESHLEQDKCIDQVQNHSSSCPDPKLHRAVGGGDAPNRHLRSIYTKLLQEISEINDSVVVEALRNNIAFPKKKRATKRCLEKKNEEFEALDGNHATVKKRVPKPCARNKSTEPSKVGQSLVSLPASLEITTADTDGIETLIEDDGGLCKKGRASNRHPRRIRCAERSGEQLEYAICSVKAAKSHTSGSSETLEGSQSISLAPKCSISKMMDHGNSGASSVCQHAKMSRTRDKTYSNQILERNDGDDTTLTCFLRDKLKKRRVELSENGNGACCTGCTGGSDFAYQGNRSTS